MRSLRIAVVAAVAALAASADAAPGAIELGFVRGDSISLASRDGTHQRVVLRAGRRSSYSHPAWSRSGRLAVTRHIEPDEGHGYSEIVISDPGRAPVLVASDGVGFPAWAPDERRLAMMNEYDGSGDGGAICVAVVVGRSCRDLSTHYLGGPFFETTPAWSPNGKWIAFARGKLGRRGTEFKLFLIHPNGTGRRRLTARSILNPSWSPDGHRIAFDDGRDLYVLNVDGSGVRRLTKTGAGARATDPAWSPDGAQIAYVRARSNAPSTSGDIWIADASGAHPRLVIRHATQPAWKGR